MRKTTARLALTLAICAALGAIAHAATPVLAGQTERPLRYRPVDRGFVIDNGPDSFNRPLYGGYTAFRADAGDRPEFSLYLPGRGGVLRVGLVGASGTKWLRDAGSIEATYVDASMRYAIRDPAFGDATIRLVAVALRDDEGLAVRVTADNLAAPADVLFAFGGTSTEKFRRDGDIGTESQPVSQLFALRPDHCRENVIETTDAGFTLSVKNERLAASASGGETSAKVVDARKWHDADALRKSDRGDSPAALVTVRLTPGKSASFVVRRMTAATTLPAATAPTDLDAIVDRALEQNRAVARQVNVETPDPFVDAAVDAMNVAADALWDEKAGSVMHGGVAWRRRYLGWRGPYAPDAMGDHDRVRRHLEGYFTSQNTKPIDPDAKGSDENESLARSEKLLHSNGDLTNSHYDMNLVAVDNFFRHLLWTGDVEWAAKQWPVIERHLAWERRLFRRDFKDGPLYEAYAAIWASDDLQYNGGGVTHASAYNYWHNRMATRVAAMLGHDAKPYADEADAIATGMRAQLWLADRGQFAEYKDWLGERLVHPSFGLWTHYHTIDSEVPDALEAWQMCRAVEATIPRIPIHGPGIPNGDFATLASTDWMPYTWSVNNVAMAEVTHTALADWQAGRREQAMSTWKGAVLDSMFVGQTPGNLHMTSFFDAYRAESQRDSGDPVGATWRATIEGLFGIKPDALAGVLTLRPGFPDEWDHASIAHPDLSYAFKRDAKQTTYKVESRFAKPMRLKLIVPAERVDATVTINGEPAKWTNVDGAVGRPAIAIEADAAAAWNVAIAWSGDEPKATTDAPKSIARGEALRIESSASIVELRDPQGVMPSGKANEHLAAGLVGGAIGDRTLFLRVRQGGLTWWHPIEVEVEPQFAKESAKLDGSTITLDVGRLASHINSGMPASVEDAAGTLRVLSEMRDDQTKASSYRVDDVPITLGTNRFGIRLAGLNDVTPDKTFTVTDWSRQIPADAKLDAVDLSSAFNDRVTNVFAKGKYVSPRSPFASLAMPTQGFGGWATNKTVPSVDDSGLRALGGELKWNGLVFKTPGEADAKNVLFVSQWDNYPREASVPLTGRARQAYLLMAGTTNAMQSRFDNGEVIVTYADGGTERLALRNPETWWPIDQDYFVDEGQYRLDGPIPPRVDLKTGTVRLPTRADLAQSKRNIPGGAATILNVPLDPRRELKSITVRAIANEVVIGLMSATLLR